MRNFFVITTAAAILGAVSCSGIHDPEVQIFSNGTESGDSLARLCFAVGGASRCEIFIYESSALQKLQRHLNVKGSYDVLCTETDLPPGEYTVVALADGPWTFNGEALGTFDAMESLTVPFCQENPSLPLRSAIERIVCPCDTVFLNTSPLMASVELSCVESRFSGTLASERIKDLKIYLLNVNAAAQPARTMGFRPEIMLDGGGPEASDLSDMIHPECICRDLESDLGYFALYPHCRLYCYPNDPAEEEMGSPRTVFVLEGTLCGKCCRWETELPAIHRGAALSLEYIIYGEDEFKCFVYQ